MSLTDRSTWMFPKSTVTEQDQKSIMLVRDSVMEIKAEWVIIMGYDDIESTASLFVFMITMSD